MIEFLPEDSRQPVDWFTYDTAYWCELCKRHLSAVAQSNMPKPSGPCNSCRNLRGAREAIAGLRHAGRYLEAQALAQDTWVRWPDGYTTHPTWWPNEREGPFGTARHRWTRDGGEWHITAHDGRTFTTFDTVGTQVFLTFGRVSAYLVPSNEA